MPKENGEMPEKPVFDFSELSYGDMKQVTRWPYEMRAAEAENDIAKVEAVIAKKDALYASTIVSVPREWLIKSAPETIEWSDPASLNYLRADKVDALEAAMVEARTGAAKN